MAITAAEGVRIGWEQVPAPVRAAIEVVCGAAVVEARTQPGGFSPGLAARVRCANGTRYFVKAVSAQANPDTPGLHRQEGRVLATLDPLIISRQLPVLRLCGTVDRPPWMALILEDVAGRQPAVPFTGWRSLAASGGRTVLTPGRTGTWTSWQPWRRRGPITRPATRCCTLTSAPTTFFSPGRARSWWTGRGPAGGAAFTDLVLFAPSARCRAARRPPS